MCFVGFFPGVRGCQFLNGNMRFRMERHKGKAQVGHKRDACAMLWWKGRHKRDACAIARAGHLRHAES